MAITSTPAAAPVLPKQPNPVIAFVKAQPLGAFGVVVIAVYLVCAIGSNWLAPYDPEAVDFVAARPRALVRHRPIRPRRA